MKKVILMVLVLSVCRLGYAGFENANVQKILVRVISQVRSVVLTSRQATRLKQKGANIIADVNMGAEVSSADKANLATLGGLIDTYRTAGDDILTFIDANYKSIQQ